MTLPYAIMRIAELEKERDKLLERIKQLEAVIIAWGPTPRDKSAEVGAAPQLYELYLELRECKWIRMDGEENKLAIIMANLQRKFDATP